jgi:hypothetical protein
MKKAQMLNLICRVLAGVLPLLGLISFVILGASIVAYLVSWLTGQQILWYGTR